jgi:SAM-dependent methyltransferase
LKTTRELVRSARDHFNRALHGDEYRRITWDERHVHHLIDLLQPGGHQAVLDLGTGSGAVAFEIGRRFPGCRVVGIDVAEVAIARNIEKAVTQGTSNVDFQSYSGTKLPFEDASFDGVTSRYAFHHLPEPELSVAEMSRVLRRVGRAVISDPVPFDEDTGGFIDDFQRLKPDGHVRFYRRTELEELFAGCGLHKAAEFHTQIAYPRPMDRRYEELLKRTPRVVLERYRVQVRDTEVFVKVDVGNTLFQKG